MRTAPPVHEIALAVTAGWPEYNRPSPPCRGVPHREMSGRYGGLFWAMKAALKGAHCLLSLAADHQLLLMFWPEVRSDVSYFADQVEPIPLLSSVWPAPGE
eukprot:gene1378-biopygen1115